MRTQRQQWMLNNAIWFLRNVTPGVVQWALQKCKISYRIPYATLTQTDGLC